LILRIKNYSAGYIIQSLIKINFIIKIYPKDYSFNILDTHVIILLIRTFKVNDTWKCNMWREYDNFPLKYQVHCHRAIIQVLIFICGHLRRYYCTGYEYNQHRKKRKKLFQVFVLYNNSIKDSIKDGIYHIE